MFQPLTGLILAALSVAACFPSAAAAQAEQKPASIPAWVVWTEPPEAVKADAAALRTACATWTQKAPRPDILNLADVQRGPAWCMDRLVGAEKLGRVEGHLLS